MPTYQYACTECDHRFEQFQSFSDDSLTHCPVCDGRLRKVFNAVGVVFKGSGFYRTDSRDASKKGASSDTSASAQGSGSSSDGKPAETTKPETKTSETKTPEKPASTSTPSTSSSASSSTT